MVRSDTDFLIQSDAICDRWNNVIDKVLYTYLVSCENKFADDYGEWFNVKISELKDVLNGESEKVVMLCIYRLQYHGYIQITGYKPDILRIRVRTFEEREENGCRPSKTEMII